ncbi:MAG: LytR C-terminal domain-containing protein [Patescibacteria group bacterium]
MKKRLPQGEPRWQKEQKEKKQKRNFLAVRLWFVFALVLILLGLGLKTYRVVKNSIWDGSSRINFVLKGEEAILASFEPGESLTLIPIPKGTNLLLTHGYGKYRVEAVLGLEELEKRQALLVETIQENLGVPVEGWIRITNYKLQITNYKEGILNELENQILGKGKTNFSTWDILRLWWEIKKIREGEIEVLDLEKLNVFSQSKLPDGTVVLEIAPAQLDVQIQKYLADSQVKKEKLAIEVLNGTSYLGLAERGARILTNIGGEVVAVGNSEVGSEKCEVESEKKNKNSYTVLKIIKIFSCSWREKKEEGRGEITLILGEDYWQKLNQK